MFRFEIFGIAESGGAPLQSIPKRTPARRGRILENAGCVLKLATTRWLCVCLFVLSTIPEKIPAARGISVKGKMPAMKHTLANHTDIEKKIVTKVKIHLDVSPTASHTKCELDINYT